MAYNNGFPINYQQYYPQYSQTQTQPQPMNNSIIWVQGEAGAKSYMVAPNTTVQLWDSEQQVIYLKSADASGMPSMKIIDYTIRGSETPNTVLNDLDNNFIRKEELDVLKGQIQALEKEINKLKPRRREAEHHG